MSIPVNLKDLLEGGATFEFDLNKCRIDDDEDKKETAAVLEEMQKFPNYNCEGQFDELFDEDTYVQGQPFEVIATKMTNITGDGGVKKRILREGYANTPPDLAVVKIHYNAYVEFESIPYDSTYARKKPHKFIVNHGEVLPGLDVAVQTMKLSEKSQFLVAPEYGFGKLGCLGRIPPNATILFEVEMLEILDSGAALNYNDLPKEEQQKFNVVLNYCQALCNRGKDMFKMGNINGAIKEYNTAVGQLEVAALDDYNEQEQQSEMLEKLYTNLLVCYTKVDKPKKALINFNKLKSLFKETNKSLTSKILFNCAKAYRLLDEFDRAKSHLEDARRLDPKNVAIANEFIVLEEEIQQYKKREKEIAKKIMGDKKD